MKIESTYSRLIKLSSEMVQGKSMPDVDLLRLPKNTSWKLRRALILQERAAEDQCRQWANQICEIAIAIVEEKKGSL